MRTTRSSSVVPHRYLTQSSAPALVQYSTKQKPHGVSALRSRPMTMRLSGPQELKSSWICSSLVWNARLPTYTVRVTRKQAT